MWLCVIPLAAAAIRPLTFRFSLYSHWLNQNRCVPLLSSHDSSCTMLQECSKMQGAPVLSNHEQCSVRVWWLCSLRHDTIGKSPSCKHCLIISLCFSFFFLSLSLFWPTSKRCKRRLVNISSRFHAGLAFCDSLPHCPLFFSSLSRTLSHFPAVLSQISIILTSMFIKIR